MSRRNDDEPLNPATVVRIHRHDNPYVMIERSTVQDERLSWEARGLLVYLLSLPPDWDIRVSHLQKQGDAGRDALRRILRELQGFGYVSGFGESERAGRGRFGQSEIRVYESPRLNPHWSQGESPEPEKPSPLGPSPDSPSPEKASPYKGDNPQRGDLTKDTHTNPRAHARRSAA